MLKIPEDIPDREEADSRQPRRTSPPLQLNVSMVPDAPVGIEDGRTPSAPTETGAEMTGERRSPLQWRAQPERRENAQRALDAWRMTQKLQPPPQEDPREIYDLAEKHPVLAQRAGDPNWMMAARHDLPELGRLERIFEIMGEGWKRGKAQYESSLLGWARVIGYDTPAIRSRIKKLNEAARGGVFLPRNIPERAAGETTEISPMMKGGLETGTKWGLRLALAAGIAGQIPPLSALPEELITMPAAFGAGMVGGVAYHSYQVEAGGAFNEYLEEGIPETQAKIGAHLTGAVNTFLEIGSLSLLAGTIPGLKEFLKLGVRRGVKKALAKRGVLETVGRTSLDYLKYLTGEIAVEVAQEATTAGVGEGLKAATDTGEALSLEDWSDRIGEIIEKSAYSFAVLGLPGTGVKLYSGLKQNRAAQAKQAALDFIFETEVVLQRLQMAEQSPEALEVYLDDLVKTGEMPEMLWVQAEKLEELFQEGLTADQSLEILDQLGVDLEQFREAQVNKSAVAVPVKKLGAAVRTPIWEGLKKELSFSPEEEHEAAVERLSESRSRLAEKVEKVRTGMAAAGRPRFEVDMAEAMLTARARTWAAQRGADPADWPWWNITFQRAEDRAAAEAGLNQIGIHETSWGRVYALHDVRSADYVNYLASEMEKNGWIGPPILAIETADRLQALTGTHRLAAAEKAGIEPDLFIIKVDTVYDPEDAEVEATADLYDRLIEARDDDDRLAAIKDLVDAGFVEEEALKIMEEETIKDDSLRRSFLKQGGTFDPNDPRILYQADIIKFPNVRVRPPRYFYVSKTGFQTSFDSVHWYLNRDGTFKIELYRGGDRVASEFKCDYDKLVEHLGYNLANQIVNKSGEIGVVGEKEFTGQYSIRPGEPGVPPIAKEITRKIAKRYGKILLDEGRTDKLYQTGPVWYSQLRQVLASKLPGGGPPDQFIKTIQSWAKKGEFKKEELEWSGLIEWLQAQEGKITKEDVLNFLDQGGVRVEEVVKDSEPSELSEEDREEWVRARANDLFEEDLDLLVEDALAAGELDEFLEEGIINYEKLQEIKKYLRSRDYYEYMEKAEQEFEKEENEENIGDTKFNRSDLLLPGGENYRELLIIWPEGAGFKGSHWEEPNVLAHVRFNERTDADGNRVLFVEEIQSDWHQKGREKGYRTETLPETYQIRPVEEEKLEGGSLAGGFEVVTESGRVVSFGETEDQARQNALDRINLGGIPHLVLRIEKDTGIIRSVDTVPDKIGAVPDAPFKSTSAWSLLVMKRVIRWAAENGFDRVAWTTGAQQAERYDLSKQVERIEWDSSNDAILIRFNRDEPLDDWTGKHLSEVIDPEISAQILSQTTGRAGPFEWTHQGDQYNVRAVPKGMDYAPPDFDKSGLTIDQVAEFIGKDLAEKIKEKSDAGEASGEFTGLDLQVGGEGMSAFYDQMLPNIVGKYIKKWGSKVENLEVKNVGTVPGFEVTPEMRRSVLEVGQPMFQRKPPSRPKASIQFQIPPERLDKWGLVKDYKVAENERQVLINFWKSADLSSAPHEFFHIFRRDMELLALDPTASDQERADWQTVCEFVGAKPGEYWTKEQEEKFAAAGEQYLREGRAPTKELQPFFERFRRWFLALFRAARDNQYEISPAIREVFDRLLAVEQETEAAAAEAEMRGTMWGEERPRTITPEVWAEYERAMARAQAAAAEVITARRAEQKEKLRHQWLKEGKIQADQHPMHLLMDEIVKRGGLNKGKLSQDYGPETVAALARKRVGLVRNEGKLAIDELADEHGYPDGDALVNELIDTPTKKQMARDYMEAQEEYEESLWDVQEEVLTDDFEEVLELEEKMLSTVLGDTRHVPPKTSALVKEAKRKVGGLRVQELKTRKLALQAAYKKAARTAREAYREDRINAARAAKTEQRRLMAEYKEIARAEREITLARDYFVRVLKTKPQALDKAQGIEWGALQQIRGLLARYDIVPRSFQPGPGTPSLQDWVDDLRAEGETVTISPDIVDGSAVRPFHDLQVNELRELRDAVKQLEHHGRNRKKLIASKRHAELDAAIGEVVMAALHARQQAPPKSFEEVTDVKSGFRKFVDGVKGLKAELVKVEFICRALDGFQDLGAAWHNLFEPIKKAEDKELKLGAETEAKIKAAFEKIPAEQRKDWRTKRHRIDGGPEQMLTREQMIMAALNSGTEGNRRYLISGLGWKPEEVQAVLNNLTREEWALVQEIWGIINELFPLLDEAHYLATGVHLTKVEGVTVKTPFGEIEGQYFPGIFDPRLSKEAERFELERREKDLFAHQYSRPSTRARATYERVGGKLPPLLSFNAIGQHVREVIHDACYRNAVRDVQKIIGANQVRSVVIGSLGEEIYNQMMPWLKEQAKPDWRPIIWWERWMDWLCKRTTLVMLGMKATTIIQQPLAFLQTIDKLGLKASMRGAKAFMADVQGSVQFINERSEAMRQRRKQWDREINRFTNEFFQPSAVGKMENVDWFAPIGWLDQYTAYPTWLGAYMEGLKTRTEEDAVEYADMVVRTTQATGAKKDLSAVQRSQWLRLITLFYTHFNLLHNLLAERNAQYRESKISAGHLAASYWWLVVAPAIFGYMLTKRQLPDDPEDLAGEILTYWAGGIPLWRDAAYVLFGGGWDYQLSPLEDNISTLINLGNDIKKIMTGKWDKVKPERMLQRAAESAGFVFGLPTKQAVITMTGILDLITGESRDPSRLLFWPRPKDRD